jgi:Mg2+ and Co2+ transporter CorA
VLELALAAVVALITPNGAVAANVPVGVMMVRDSLEHTPECSRGQLVYRILDTLADSVSDTLQTVTSRIDLVAQTILTRPRASDRDRMAVLGRSLGPLHRTLTIQRRVFDRAVNQIAAIADPSEDLGPYLADVADHLSQALDDVDADHDTLRAMIDTYANAVDERLTIVATIFLPLSVLTGFFGMNFTWLLDHQGGVWTFFGLGVGGLLASSLVIVAWLRRTGMTNRHQRPPPHRGRAAGRSAAVDSEQCERSRPHQSGSARPVHRATRGITRSS